MAQPHPLSFAPFVRSAMLAERAGRKEQAANQMAQAKLELQTFNAQRDAEEAKHLQSYRDASIKQRKAELALRAEGTPTSIERLADLVKEYGGTVSTEELKRAGGFSPRETQLPSDVRSFQFREDLSPEARLRFDVSRRSPQRPVTVSPGGTLVSPETGEVVFQAQPRGTTPTTFQRNIETLEGFGVTPTSEELKEGAGVRVPPSAIDKIRELRDFYRDEVEAGRITQEQADILLEQAITATGTQKKTAMERNLDILTTPGQNPIGKTAALKALHIDDKFEIDGNGEIVTKTPPPIATTLEGKAAIKEVDSIINDAFGVMTDEKNNQQVIVPRADIAVFRNEIQKLAQSYADQGNNELANLIADKAEQFIMLSSIGQHQVRKEPDRWKATRPFFFNPLGKQEIAPTTITIPRPWNTQTPGQPQTRKAGQPESPKAGKRLTPTPKAETAGTPSAKNWQEVVDQGQPLSEKEYQQLRKAIPGDIPTNLVTAIAKLKIAARK